MAADRCRNFTLTYTTGQVTQTMTNAFANYPSLAGKTVFVTGGASGIGAEIVKAFSAQGAKVGFIDLDRPASAALAGELGATTAYEICDLRDIGALQKAFAA